MEILVTAKPHMLLETVELLFAYVNCIPAEELTCNGSFCLPEETVQSIMDTACGDLSREDPNLWYYFSAHTLPDDVNGATCIARNLVYASMHISCGSLEAEYAWLKSHWDEYSSNVVAVGPYSLRFETAESSVSLADSISCLNMDSDYTRKLQEQLSDFGSAIDRLYALIAPVSERLEKMLTLWVTGAEERARQWQDALSGPEAAARFMKEIRFRNREQVDRIHIQLRYLDSGHNPGIIGYDTTERSEMSQYVFIHMGVFVHPFSDREPELFDDWEFEAMHLLGNPMRLRILHALWNRPMTTRELAKALNLNLGNLSRDINNLYNCKLLVIETVQERRRYCTNREAMKTLGEHLTRFGILQLS